MMRFKQKKDSRPVIFLFSSIVALIATISPTLSKFERSSSRLLRAWLTKKTFEATVVSLSTGLVMRRH